MATFLNFILLVFIAIVLIIALFAYRLYSQIHQAADNFRRQMNKHHHHSSHTHSEAGDEETIIDRRTLQEANKKIFSKDEGEYVDYQE
ncbi:MULTISPECIES: DUF4834 family protein [Prevotellaceae]|uniref:DUF4834 family protein n=1 Tax=Prevotellaceae TaxID=171552 RepID=UPI0003D38136|nr:DUF4834 family protein [Prevotella phocaeensis]ETD16014.1 hypothetical protein HMPREF1199_02306 [Hoylesella oralis CC98A]